MIVLGNDQEAYKDFCQRAMQQFMSYENEEQAERILKSCLLRPGSVDFLKPAADYLNSLLDEGKTHASFAPWGWATRALWSYRSGDAAATVKAVQASEAAQPTEMVHVLNLVLLALAEHELQHGDCCLTSRSGDCFSHDTCRQRIGSWQGVDCHTVLVSMP